jgi:hypothetical protein
MPSIIVIEGISYYLQKTDLKAIIDTFSRLHEAHFIIEYLVPDNYISNERRHIPQEIFDIIHDNCELESITSYIKDELQSFFEECGGKFLNRYTLTDMELYRTAVNTYFKNSTDGWIECLTAITGTHYHEK